MTYNAEQITYMLAEAIDRNREYKSWHCSTQHLMALVERVVAEEREACAKIADSQLLNTNALLTAPIQSSAAYHIGVSIRERGQA